MYPGYKLSAIAKTSAQTKSHQPQKHVERSVLTWTHYDCRAHQHLARIGSCRCVEFAVPFLHNIDAEVPCVRSIGFRSTDNSGLLVVRFVVAVGIERGCARLQPNGRGSVCFGDSLPDN